MRPPRNPGRVAGLWYLLLVVLGPPTLIIIPNKLFVPNDAAATTANIAAHQTLLLTGMALDLAGAIVLIFLTLAFYRLFKDVDQGLAVFLVITGGVLPAALNFVNVVNYGGALTVAQAPDFLAAFDQPQRNALVMLFLRLHHYQIVAAEVLWGVWLFPMGALAYKSRFIPRFIGVWLVINGGVYLALSFAGLFFPSYQDRLFTYAQPVLFGEIAIMLWLVIKGAVPRVTVNRTAGS